MKTVKEVATELKISEHTLRFWAKSGLLPPVLRDKNNVRLFSDDDINWVFIIKCLRDSGVQLVDIKKYISLCKEGDSTSKERYKIILEAKEKTLNNINELKKQLDKLKYKENYYKNIIDNKLQDSCNPLNKIKRNK